MTYQRRRNMAMAQHLMAGAKGGPVSDDAQEVRWTAFREGVRVEGAGEDIALLYRVLRPDDVEEWVVKGSVGGRSHSGSFEDGSLAHDVLGLLAEMMQREMPEKDDG